MLNKIIIIILSFVLLVMLAKAFVKMFEWDVEFEKSKKQWVKIIKVKVVKKDIYRKRFGSYSNWLATIQFPDGRTTNVPVVVSPKPKVGQCLPVLSSEVSNGKIVALLDNQEWQFGTEYGTCK
ncbi:MAG TPA: hypothetical protein ENJ44_08080 [Oceanospirillales bacterium]|nr:hypothetical protein [Oceanospirillales bacterium]